MAARKIPFLEENNDTIELSKTSRGYYAQVQCAMAVTQLLTCDFVVWSRQECIVLEVPFDSEYWDDLIRSCAGFTIVSLTPIEVKPEEERRMLSHKGNIKISVN